MVTVRMPTAPEDFDGDGGGPEVCVIRADRLLWDALDTTLSKPAHQSAFERGDPAHLPLAGQGNLAPMFERVRLASQRMVRRAGIGDSLSRRSVGLFNPVGFGDTADGNSGIAQRTVEPAARVPHLARQLVRGLTVQIAADGVFRQGAASLSDPRRGVEAFLKSAMAHPAFSRKSVDALSSLITADEIVEIGWSQFSGHVYNLETVTGWYVAEGILTHNCRCAVAPIVFEEGEEARAPGSIRRKRHERPRWTGEERQAHITALGREHARLERLFLGKLKRGFQHQQNAVLRKLREVSKE
jgi:hypothetical protein